MAISISGQEVSSVFRLIGNDEKSITHTMGWVLGQSDAFRKTFLHDVGCVASHDEEPVLTLQQHHAHGGYTDIELDIPNQLSLIVEAKVGWNVPSQSQLELYARRLLDESPHQRMIISVSAATQRYASASLPDEALGIPVIHRSWAEISQSVERASALTRKPVEKFILDEFQKHLRGFVSMRDINSNLAYVLVLSGSNIHPDRNYTWIDIVEKDHSYFHPFGINGWPALPPNYLAFRYGGQLRSVHHVEGYDIVGDLSVINPNWQAGSGEHLLYRLGSPMRPANPLPNGRVFANGRYWCALDTLLSGAYPSIADARDETQRREAAK